MLKFPGFIDICTDVPAGCWSAYSDIAVRGGYTALLAAPNVNEVYTQKEDTAKALEEAGSDSVCDYAKLAVITPENIRSIGEWASEVPAALVDFSLLSSFGAFSRMNMLSRLFHNWPAEKPICVRGSEDQVGSAIFMGQTQGRRVHVCSASTQAEMELIAEAREADLPVTCDVNPLALLFSTETANTPKLLSKLGNEEDRRALWQHLDLIDCFSSAGFTGPRGISSDSLSMTLPLLLSMYNAKMLTAEDITARCCVNPAKIFGIALDESTVIEVDETKAAAGSKSRDYVQSVTLRGQMIYSAADETPSVARRAARVKGIGA